MNKFLKVIAFAFIAFIPAAVFGQSFEGVIEFKKMTGNDTTGYVYYIKGNNVRIDEIGARSKKVEGSFLIDTKAGTMKFLSHDRKTWGEHKSGAAPAVGGKPVITKTTNVKMLHGYKCTEYVVKNADENASISFWIASGKFNFFKPMLKLLNRKEKFATYYPLLPVKDGAFAMLAVQSDNTGKETGRLEVTRLEKKTVDASLFAVPKDYSEFK